MTAFEEHFNLAKPMEMVPFSEIRTARYLLANDFHKKKVPYGKLTH